MPLDPEDSCFQSFDIRFPKAEHRHKIYEVLDLPGAHHRIGMYLAGILALCALLHVSASGRVRGEFSSSGAASAHSFQQSAAQEPAKPDTPPNPPQPKQDTTQPAPPQAEPSQPQPNAPAEASPDGPSSHSDSAPAGKSAARNKHTAKTADDEQHKRVIHRGGTVEPTTQLAPGMTQEQAARQRQNTNKLLTSTDASLQKLSGRQLTKDEQDTVAQIRRFMQQVKAADAAGDLQRAYKLAVKAHLLSDALAKP
jgi:hypothetical protein